MLPLHTREGQEEACLWPVLTLSAVIGHAIQHDAKKGVFHFDHVDFVPDFFFGVLNLGLGSKMGTLDDNKRVSHGDYIITS